ncbi:MAG: hypothetical protein OXB88_05335 [Bacteriovoracales bacterium]|nr:hypothetical protein [Bacteriovoracales bacterium]
MGNETEKEMREDFWKGMKEIKEMQKDTAQRFKETERRFQDTERRFQDTDRQFKEEAQESKKARRQLDKEIRKLMRSIDDTNGRFNTKWGKFLENLVYGDLVNLLNERGIQVNRIHPRLRCLVNHMIVAEYDLVAVNGDEVVVFEVKTTLGRKSVAAFIKKLETFKEHFPEHRDKKIYGGIAYMSDKNGSGKAIEEGLFVVKAPGGPHKVSTLVNPLAFRPKSF